MKEPSDLQCKHCERIHDPESHFHWFYMTVPFPLKCRHCISRRATMAAYWPPRDCHCGQSGIEPIPLEELW